MLAKHAAVTCQQTDLNDILLCDDLLTDQSTCVLHVTPLYVYTRKFNKVPHIQLPPKSGKNVEAVAW